MGGYTEWKIGERSVGGMMTRPPQLPAEVPNYWGVYFAVADIEARLARPGGPGPHFGPPHGAGPGPDDGPGGPDDETPPPTPSEH